MHWFRRALQRQIPRRLLWRVSAQAQKAILQTSACQVLETHALGLGSLRTRERDVKETERTSRFKHHGNIPSYFDTDSPYKLELEVQKLNIYPNTAVFIMFGRVYVRDSHYFDILLRSYFPRYFLNASPTSPPASTSAKTFSSALTSPGNNSSTRSNNP